MDCSGRADSWLLRNRLALCAMVLTRDVCFQLAGRGVRNACIGLLGRGLPVRTTRRTAQLAVSFDRHADALRRRVVVAGGIPNRRVEGDQLGSCFPALLDCCLVPPRFWLPHRFLRQCLAVESNHTSAGFDLRLCQSRCCGFSWMVASRRGRHGSDAPRHGCHHRCRRPHHQPAR